MTRDIHADAKLLGGEVHSRRIDCAGPGHRSSDRSLSLWPSKGSPLGYGFTSWCNDDFKICADYIRSKLGLPAFAPGAGYEPPKVRYKLDAEIADSSEGARKIWLEAGSVRGTVAERYLRDDRGLRLDADLNWDHVLRFHKKCRFEGRNYPAMIALFRDCVSDEPRAIQRTFLTKEGHKIGRRMLGPVKGCAIKIDRLGGDHLAVGEGLETCLAARIFGYQPAWAVGSAGAIASFPIIPGVKALTIFGENDKSGANERAIDQLRVSWGDGFRIVKVKPDEGYSDLNDAWLALSEASIEDRTEIFGAICNKFWPGASIVPVHQGSSGLETLQRIGYRAFGVQ